MKHNKYDANDTKSDYWKFTFAEKGTLDVPAAIKYIKDKAGVDKVAYIGYSQGNILMTYALAKMEEEFFADNVSVFVSLAPCLNKSDLFYDYDTFIATDWKGVEKYPNFFGKGWTKKGF